ncbi:hypothetical protein Moror_13513 [Moniliophthora roreri MCA 2997]|uniref:Bacteriophage T5 Orf172 DNA-binding domain-containing protein n=1 Tax=Moniliophthora roreri (strain MCA 2997) TaxID=1381753 RepID=V2WUF0_MONRO|nr:hypothetical protein Moror_13513 [Moniliophthora roreri MCA 2997]
MVCSFAAWIAQIKFTTMRFLLLSKAEEEGNVYCFQILDLNDRGFLFKIGHTSRPLDEWQKEWDAKCNLYVHVWYLGIPVSASHCIKQLIHLSLEAHGIERVWNLCPKCGVHYNEIFCLPSADAWETMI